MADGEESPFLNSHSSNGCPSGLDFSNASAANVSSSSFSKILSMAQNLTRSVFTRSGSQPAPASTSHPRKEKPIRSFEGYVSNDEDDFDGIDNSRPLNRQNTNSSNRDSDAVVDNVTSMTKRPFTSALDESSAFPAAKRSKFDETLAVITSNQSSTFRSHRRFWTSGKSISRPLYRPPPVSSSKLMPLFIPDKAQSLQMTPTNVFSVAERSIPRPLSSASSASGTASFATLSSISELNRKSAARNSETKRILLDLERVGGLPTPDSKRPRLWFQTVSDETTPIPRTAEKKRAPFGPPVTTLRTTDKAQVLPTVMSPFGGSSFRSIRSEQTPPIPAASKRAATNEANGPFRETTATVFGKTTTASACKFTFSRPLPVSLSAATDKTVASIPDISQSKKVNSNPTEAVPATSKPKWSCSSCFISNEATVNECACCKTPRASQPKSSTGDSSGTLSKLPQLDSTEKKLSSWSCSTCFISNNADRVNCIACQSPKPGAVKPVDASSAAVSIDTQMSTSKGPANFGKSSDLLATMGEAPSAAVKANGRVEEPKVSQTPLFGNALPKDGQTTKKAAGNDIQKTNENQLSTKILEFGTPNMSTGDGQTAVSFGNSPFVFGTQKPARETGAAESTTFSASAPWSIQSKPSATPASSVGTGTKTTNPELMEKKLPNWGCTTCFLSNTADRVKCIACQSPKPGAAFKPVRLGASFFGPPSAPPVSSNTVTPEPSFPAKFGMSSDLPTTKIETKPAEGASLSFGNIGKTNGGMEVPKAAPAAIPFPTTFNTGKPDGQTPLFGIAPLKPSLDSKATDGVEEPKKIASALPALWTFGKPNGSAPPNDDQAEKTVGNDMIKKTMSESQLSNKLFEFGAVKTTAAGDGQTVVSLGNSATPFTFGTPKPAGGPVVSFGSLGKTNGGGESAVSSGTSFNFGKPNGNAPLFGVVAPKTSLDSSGKAISGMEEPKTTSSAIAFPNMFGSGKPEGQTPLFGFAAASKRSLDNTDKTTDGMEEAKKVALPSLWHFGKSNGNGPLNDDQLPEKTVGNDIKKTMSESHLSNKIFEFGSTNTTGGDGQTVVPFGNTPVPPITFGAPKPPGGPPSFEEFGKTNPFSVSSSSSATPISGRRQLVAKRKAKRT